MLRSMCPVHVALMETVQSPQHAAKQVTGAICATRLLGKTSARNKLVQHAPTQQDAQRNMRRGFVVMKSRLEFE